jgi:hypothetical protein
MLAGIYHRQIIGISEQQLRAFAEQRGTLVERQCLLCRESVSRAVHRIVKLRRTAIWRGFERFTSCRIEDFDLRLRCCGPPADRHSKAGLHVGSPVMRQELAYPTLR